MKRIRRRVIFPCLMASALILSCPSQSPLPQENNINQKPKYDYMSTFLSRNTKPLGLKEDKTLQKLLKQPSFVWAIRSGAKHILD